MEFVIVIPARLESSRLPGKVLKDISGKSMLLRVVERCKLAQCTNRIVLCTDSKEIINIASDWGIEVLLTKSQFNSGSERIGSVVNKILANKKLEESLILNVQGDQPFIDPKIIDKAAALFVEKKPEVITPIYRLQAQYIHDPNIVKVIINSRSEAIYFSRSAIPHVRDTPKEKWHKKTSFWGHVGMYGFRGDVISNWGNIPYSVLADCEMIEHLNLIESGSKIYTFKVNNHIIGIDTYEQLENARKQTREE